MNSKQLLAIAKNLRANADRIESFAQETEKQASLIATLTGRRRVAGMAKRVVETTVSNIPDTTNHLVDDSDMDMEYTMPEGH